MTNDKYTSIELSIELQKRAEKAGVELPESEKCFESNVPNKYQDIKWRLINSKKYTKIESDKRGTWLYYSYDILNEICVEHAVFFFGEEVGIVEHRGENIILLLQQNKKEEAEAYILEHCVFSK